MIDLHVHTVISDGTFSPQHVVRLASKRGLKAIAVTDHDTVAGVAPAQDEGRHLGLEVVPGVELSAHSERGILHILGYFVRIDEPDLLESLDFLSRGRRERIPKILSKLERNDVFVSNDEVESEAVGGVPGRPHLAAIMLRKGYVSARQEAFDRFLKKGAPAYVEKVKLAPQDAIEVLRKAGGVPVLAHPYSLGEEDPHRLEEIVRALMEYGLMGLEAYYSRHTLKQTGTYLDLARRLDLVITGGSDFHGANKPGVELGVIPHGGPLPYRILECLKEAVTRTSPPPDAPSPRRPAPNGLLAS
ncbi:MAG: PHP domain-containing protein [Desulfomonile tiedjei]|nr:PHP domain-containing protein [Desulfomonile tiedjei]